MAISIFQAQPSELPFGPCVMALIMIDTQRDPIEAGGFGEVLGNDVSLVRTVIAPCKEVLAAVCREGITVIHTREGHCEDLSDYPSAKPACGGKIFIDEPRPMGRILVRSEAGHDITLELHPVMGEPAINRPGRGIFYQTGLHLILQKRGIRTLIICGVTTEICVTTAMREVNNRGYEYIISEDCADSYFPEFQKYALEMIKAQGAIFGWVTDSEAVIAGPEG